METYQKAQFAEIGIADVFVQDNHSLSEKGTLREASLSVADIRKQSCAG